MKIYCLGLNEQFLAPEDIPIASVRFAFFSAVGTWTDEREPCKACGWHWQALAPPLLVQWERSSTEIGDFSWDGPYGTICVVKTSVAERLTKLGFDCHFSAVDYVKPNKKRRTVPFPYTGPRQLWLQSSPMVDLDMGASGVKLESCCDVCGDMRYTFRYEGIAIHRDQWNGRKIFRISTNGRADTMFVSEEGLRLLEETGFTNVQVRAAGEIVD